MIGERPRRNASGVAVREIVEAVGADGEGALQEERLAETAARTAVDGQDRGPCINGERDVVCVVFRECVIWERDRSAEEAGVVDLLLEGRATGSAGDCCGFRAESVYREGRTRAARCTRVS